MARTAEGKSGGTGIRSSCGKPFSRDPRFKELERLGEGGKAYVLKVEDTDASPLVPDRILAVKKLSKEHAALDEQRRIRREGAEDRQFDHPNVVRIFELRGGPRSPYLVMEYIPGEDCRGLLRRHGRFDSERVIELGIQLCAAMECLHTRGLIHRDIKPGNLMVTGDFDGGGPVRLKLIDLGIALGRGEWDREIVGTKPYLAPEVQDGGQPTETSDVYEAGAVLYELATGSQLPELSEQEAWERCRAEPLTPPHVLEPTVPRWLGEVIMRAVSVDPAQRFSGAEEMWRALNERGAVASEAPTTVIGGADEEATRVIGAKREPIVFRLIGALPPWLLERLPENWREQEPVHWYLFLLALAAVPFLLAIVWLPVEIEVIVALYELPRWLLTTGVLLTLGTAWFLREEDRRGAAARFIAASARSLALAAAAAWSWAASLSWPPPSPPPSTEGDGEPRHKGGRARLRSRGRRSPFKQHGERRRAWSSMRQGTVCPLLRDARSQLAEAGSAARAWTPWLVRHAYFIVLAALAFCLAFWLAPALQHRVSQQPADHRTVLTAVPAAVWIAIALVGLLLLRSSKASPRGLLIGGLALLVSLTVLGMLMPSFSAWLEPRFWPDDPVAKAQDGDQPSPTAEPDPASEARETARLISRKLVGRVHSMEGRWMQLLWSLKKDENADWEIEPSVKPAIREHGAALIARLTSWRKIAHYESARREASSWLESMRHVASQLTTRNCHEFTIGWQGASCSR